MFRSRRGTVGPTLTWFVAFVIIFFVLIVIYLPATLSIGKWKLVKETVFGREEAELSFEEGNLIETESLIGFLNSKVMVDEEEKSISDLIIKVKKNKNYGGFLEIEIEDFVDLFEPDCYFVKFENFELKKGVEENVLDFKGIEIKIPGNGEYVNFQIYAGECIVLQEIK